MGRRILAFFVGLVAILSLPTSAIAGSLTLHPAGFGEHSRANWKAQQGLPDSTPTGNPNQALYFQKMTATATFAAGAAVIKGLEGQPASALTGLGWSHRVDGHCGAGAPRWNVNLRTASGQNHTVFLGCYAADHAPEPASPLDWCRDTYGSTAIGAAILAQTGVSPTALTIRNLVILFDEGTDNPSPQPVPGCPAGTPQPGFIYLDNITVEMNSVARVWTSASDNGNKSASLPSLGPAIALADELVPVAEILASLVDALPEVPIASWVLYPDVELAAPSVPVTGLP